MPSIKAMACVQSAVVPAVTATLTGIPCASTARCILLLCPFLCGPCPSCPLGSRCVGVDFAMAGINHQPFKIRIINQHFKEFFPYSLVSPTNKALVNGSSFAIFRRQISPRRASTQYPEYGIDEEAIILCDASPLPTLPRQMRFQ